MHARSVAKQQLKMSYRASPRSIQPIYTGGPVLLTQDGKWLVSTMGEQVVVTDVATGENIARVRGDTTAITSLALSYHTHPPTLITSHMSNAIRLYPLPQSALPATAPLLTYTRQMAKAHSSPILVSAVAPDSTLFATGSSDGVVKVWDAEGGYTTHIYRGHGGPVSALKFFFSNDKSTMELLTGSTDGKVRIFDLKDAASRVVSGGGAAKAKAVLQGHVSVVRGIDVSADGKYAVTGGRDKVVLVWDLAAGGQGSATNKGKGKAAASPKIVQTIIAHEQIEALGLLPAHVQVPGAKKDRLLCFTGGDKGQVRVWDIGSGEQVVVMKGLEGVDEVDEDDDEQRGVISVLLDPTTSSLVSVHADQNIIYNSLQTSLPTRQIIGFNDDIIDATFLTLPSLSSSSSSSSSISTHTHLALATNSSLIKLYSTADFDGRLLSGHKDMVLCLDKSPDFRLLVSGAKDQTARIWAADHEGTWRCIAICEGHAESVGAVVFSKRPDEKTGLPKFLVTASQDRTLKLWDLSTLDLEAEEPIKPRSLATIRAHEKDINSLDISPNDKFVASGSQDKFVKIFEVDHLSSSSSGPAGSLRHIGTCKGHRRGVWSVKFSKTDKILASGAADKSVRLWSLDDLSCIKTLEGHTNSVLRVDFLTNGMQLVTSSSDGLVKLWNIKDEQCVKTLDNHEDKVWALAISQDERTIVSAGADSVATFWQDSSEVEQAEKNEELIKAVQSEQDFTNYVALKDYRKAIKLALAMSQPGRLLHLFSTVHNQRAPGTYTGAPEIDEVIRTLSGLDLARLLGHVRNWNANARTSSIAQVVLHAVLRLRSPDDIIKAFELAKTIEAVNDGVDGNDEDQGQEEKKKKKAPPPLGLKEILEGLLPYSERHYARVDRLVQDSYVLDYVVGEMDGGIFGGETMDIDEA